MACTQVLRLSTVLCPGTFALLLNSSALLDTEARFITWRLRASKHSLANSATAQSSTVPQPFLDSLIAPLSDRAVTALSEIIAIRDLRKPNFLVIIRLLDIDALCTIKAAKPIKKHPRHFVIHHTFQLYHESLRKPLAASRTI
jgi:hypothetical protein